MDSKISKYLSVIGRRGGQKSRRYLDPETARNMVKIRDARKAYRLYHAQCFWSYDPNLNITISDVPWVGEQILKHGGLKLWKLGKRLCL